MFLKLFYEKSLIFFFGVKFNKYLNFFIEILLGNKVRINLLRWFLIEFVKKNVVIVVFDYYMLMVYMLIV